MAAPKPTTSLNLPSIFHHNSTAARSLSPSSMATTPPRTTHELTCATTFSYPLFLPKLTDIGPGPRIDQAKELRRMGAPRTF